MLAAVTEQIAYAESEIAEEAEKHARTRDALEVRLRAAQRSTAKARDATERADAAHPEPAEPDPLEAVRRDIRVLQLELAEADQAHTAATAQVELVRANAALMRREEADEVKAEEAKVARKADEVTDAEKQLASVEADEANRREKRIESIRRRRVAGRRARARRARSAAARVRDSSESERGPPRNERRSRRGGARV